ncbi:GyrI-like domain-containing protein [Lysobacter sp. CFH 32150]|uniref:GyrI-like domain-containing protein n=1 Tax=Lysobacter sp. CFH 32150 TaxID=2927128 RepID=UPI001FA77AE4|nr:GyrI-like domain-containing protein [Lysobacter sp. CFH 32150]MCI4566740.1 GyrI-like domain-containing protein [Lysobacter sp. CFH 32150]
MEKLDLKAEFKQLYRPSAKEVSEVNVPQFSFLMIDGEGDPNTSQMCKGAVEALFSVSYAVKFSTKKDSGIDYVVMPLEGLWWADDMSSFQKAEKRNGNGH